MELELELKQFGEGMKDITFWTWRTYLHSLAQSLVFGKCRLGYSVSVSFDVWTSDIDI